MNEWCSNSAQAAMTTLGPWDAVLHDGNAPSKLRGGKAATAFGPWSACACCPSGAASGVEESMGPWSDVSPGVEASKRLKSHGVKTSKNPKRKAIDIAQACVVDVPGQVRNHAVPVSKHLEKAKDPKAIKQRYSCQGRCACQAHKKNGSPACHRAAPLSAIIRLCIALASMSGEEKGYIFYHMYQEERERSGSRRQDWSIEGHKMCFTNFCYMLFMSPQTVRDFCGTEAGPDGKRISQRHQGTARTRSLGDPGKHVDFFFQEYYQSAGEPLPKESRRTSTVLQQTVDADVTQVVQGKEMPWLNKGDSLNQGEDEEYNPDRPAVDIMHMCTLASDGQVVGLPIRYVQHSSLWGLYWQFLAHWDALLAAGRLGVEVSRSQTSRGVHGTAPSFSTFRRRWETIWKHYLKFRKSSEHAQCNTCWEYQRIMFSKSSSVAEKLDAARHLREHIRQTYLDRQIYWNLRFASRCFLDVLVIIIDSMDKTKFAWPRYAFSKVPHDLKDLIRPRISFTIAMVHGFCVDMYAAPEALNHGADAFLEVLCRSISNVRRICRERSIPFPRHLVIQSDNTVAQAKNQYVAAFLAVLVSRRLFSSVNLFFLVVGHTHEDIDQLFGVVCSLILQMCSFQTVKELMEYLLEKLKAKFAAKTELVTHTCLTAIRDFSRWLEPLNRTVWNCWGNRQGVEAPHAFSFKLGCDLDVCERQWLGPESRSLGVSEDVYCCVKTYMRDTQLQQAPAMILPAGRVDRLIGEPSEVCSRHPLGKTKQDNYMKLAEKLKDNGLSRGAKALHDLVFDRSFSLPKFPWLVNGWRVQREDRSDSGNYFFRHLPASSWQLFAGDGPMKKKRRQDH